MPYINNKKLLEIREQARNGNEKALMILQAMRKNSHQNDIDRLVNDYYAVEEVAEPEINLDIEEELELNEGKGEIEQSEPPVELQPEVLENTNDVVDLTSVLDGEMDGLLDENEIEDTTFSTFLGNKKRDALRSRKGSDYFKAYDMAGRENYYNGKIENYKNKFSDRLKNIERRYNDMDKSIINYSQGVNDMLDDGVDLNMEHAGNAYNELTGNESVMNSFGRHWDDNDNLEVMSYLKELIVKYGKNNVIAALNTLKSDNNNYKDYLNNQVDNEIGRYSKSIEKLLK